MAATLTYQYSVRDRAGKVVTGTIDADSPAAVATKLKSMGYAPLSISEQSNAGMKMEINLPKIGAKVKLKDLAVMSRQFATMINAGLSLLRALNILAEQTENPVLAEVIGEVRNDVETGQALSAAFAKHPEIFPPLMVNMTRAGEVGGFLDRVMLQIAENYEAEVRLKGKIKSAMTYAVVVFCMAILAVVGMLIFIVPDTTGNMFLAVAIRDVQESVRQGESLTAPLNNHAVFPPMVVQMMAVGEDTGALDTMLHKIAEFYDQEVEATTEALTSLIEPLMIAFLGGIIGAMIIALYMPIFKVFDLIK